MKIITSGSPYLDIDGYAGCIAYAEFMRASGIPAKAVSTSVLNKSIPSEIRAWYVEFEQQYKDEPEHRFILIDISNPNYLDKIVELNRVEGVIDHRPGYEAYWQQKIGQATTIDLIGSACTLVYEAWQKAGLLDEISQSSARLLTCGILDNTLNLKANNASDRDRKALAFLLKQANLPTNWAKQYFTACNQGILNDFSEALLNDTKNLSFQTFRSELAVGQLVVWNGKTVIQRFQKDITDVLTSMKPLWFMNLISLEEGFSYFITDNKDVQGWLEDLLKVSFLNSVAAADRLWLRKEIVYLDQNRLQ